MSMTTILAEVRTGRIAPLGASGVSSGIDKHLRIGPVELGPVGLSGDEQADLKVHGGPDKAILHYPVSHYESWQQEFPEAADRFVPGGFGENFVTRDRWTEHDICLGDVMAIGPVRVQVTQGRQPCWKLGVRFGVKEVALRVQQSFRTGWYYRVLQQGFVQAGDELSIVDRPHPAWTVHRLMHLMFVDRLNYEALAQVAVLPELSAMWKNILNKRIEARTVEDWKLRLHPAAVPPQQ